MLDSFQFLSNKDAFISFLYVLNKTAVFVISKNSRSKQLIYNKLVEIRNKILLNKHEKLEVSVVLKIFR